MNGKGNKTCGKYSNSSGNTYVGEYKDGLKNGFGSLTWANGDKYVGFWKDNMMHGQGNMISTNGNSNKVYGKDSDQTFTYTKKDTVQ